MLFRSRPVASLSGNGWRPYLQALAALAERWDRPVVWLPFHREQDSTLLADLRGEELVPEALLARSSVQRPETPAQAIELLSSAGLVVAMRLHGLILAALAGAPVAALSYDPKVAAAAAAIGCDCREIGSDNADTLLTAWSACVDQPPDGQRLLAIRGEAERHRQVLSSLVSAPSSISWQDGGR